MVDAADAPVDFSKIRLDKSKDFGVVFPPLNGAHFQQGDLHFDHAGNLVTDEFFFGPEVRERVTKKLRVKALEDETAEYMRKRAQELGLEYTDERAETLGDDEDDVASAFDIVGWMKGDVKARFDEVREASFKQYGYKPASALALSVFMVDEGKIQQADIKRRL